MLDKILLLLSAAYVVWWVYTFITWLIPMVATPFTQWSWQSLSIWSIAAPLLFIIGGGILLVICAAIIFIVLSD